MRSAKDGSGYDDLKLYATSKKARDTGAIDEIKKLPISWEGLGYLLTGEEDKDGFYKTPEEEVELGRETFLSLKQVPETTADGDRTTLILQGWSVKQSVDVSIKEKGLMAYTYTTVTVSPDPDYENFEKSITIIPSDGDKMLDTDFGSVDVFASGDETQSEAHHIKIAEPTSSNDDSTGQSKDSDGDGLIDTTEREIGTDPNDPDTDSDGLNDSTEQKNDITNPLRSDTDSDGLNDRQETNGDTEPDESDTDGDGLEDGYEKERLGSDATRADTDSDGLDDGRERAVSTDPRNQDTDDDGLTDKQEVDGPTDSTESDTDTESDNSPPNARLSAEVSSENTGPVIRLDASDSSDPDGDELEYKWETVDGPYSEDRYPYDMTASSGPKTSVSGEISGKTFIFRVTVSDGEGSDTATTTVTVPEQPDESDDTPSLESTTTETETETEEPTTTAPPRSTTTATTGLPETSTSPTTAAPEAEWESFETDGCTSYSAGAYGGRQMYDASTDTTTVRYFVANSEEETLHITVRFNDGRDKNYTLASNANVTDSVKVKGRVDFPFIDSDCELVSTETSTTTDSISTSTTDTETPVTETETETPIKGAVDCSQFYVDTTNVTGFGPEGEGLYHIEGTVSHDSDRPLAVSFEVVMVDWNSEIVERHTVEKTLAPGETATWSVTADASYVEDSYKIGPAGQKDYECGWD